MRVERIGHYDMLENAKSAARSIIDGKENGDSRYRPAEQLGISPVNISIPGVPSDDSRSTRPSPTTPKISPKNVPKTAPSPEKEIHYEELSEEDKEKTLTKWLDEIQSGNTNHVVDCLKIKNPPKKILERLIKGDDVPFISNFPSTSRRLWIERILEDPDLNLDALEIISRVGIKENRFDGNDVWLLRTNDKIEQKILDMATGSNDWALDFLKQHPPADINFIINPELRQKYYEYEYNKNKRIFNRPVSEPSTQTKKSPEMEMAEMKKRLREELAKEENE